MKRKLLAITLVLMLMTAMLSMFSMPVAATPFAENKIAGDAKSIIYVTDFDYPVDWYTWTELGCGGGKAVRGEDVTVDTEEPGNNIPFDSKGNVGWTDHANGLQWTINVAADGDYRFSMWAASDNGANEGFQLHYNDTLIGALDHVNQEGWQEYTLYTIGDVKMTAGTHILKATWTNGGHNIAAMEIEPLVNGFPVWTPTAYKITRSGTTTIRATDFDPEPYGKAGNDGNQDVRQGHAVRTEGGNDTSRETYKDYHSNIGWIAAGDWVQYTVNVASDGVYNFVAVLATDSGEPGGVKITVGDKEVGTSAVPAKNGWQNYDKYPVGEVALEAGDHVIKVEFVGGNNFAALEVNRTGDIPSEAPAREAPTEAAAANEGSDDEPGEDGEKPTTAAANEGSDDGNNMILWIIVAVVAVVIIVVIIVFATKKKKA